MKHCSVRSALIVTLKTQLQNSSAKIKKLFDLALLFILATYSSENFFKQYMQALLKTKHYNV